MRQVVQSKWTWLGAGAFVVIAAGLWWQCGPLLAWHYARNLAAASGEDQQGWIDKLTPLDEAAVPALAGWLNAAEPGPCANIREALVALVASWGPIDGRCHYLAQRLRSEFSHASVEGQRAAVQVLTAMLRQKGPAMLPADLTQPAGEVLQEAEKRGELRQAVLGLAAALVERASPGQWLHECRALADQGLGDADADTRVAAVQLILSEPLRQDRDLLPKVVPLLRDRAPAARRAALVALAPARELVSEDDLLPLLHDPDLEVQHVCAVALRSRGLDENHILLARLIGDTDPAARLRVLQHLGRQGDLDPGVWLRRLSQDSAAAVRAAAVRAAGAYPQVDLSDRLREMAQQDPSETVRQNAQYYLRQY